MTVGADGLKVGSIVGELGISDGIIDGVLLG